VVVFVRIGDFKPHPLNKTKRRGRVNLPGVVSSFFCIQYDFGESVVHGLRWLAQAVVEPAAWSVYYCQHSV
jgi:hypothetical protein